MPFGKGNAIISVGSIVIFPFSNETSPPISSNRAFNVQASEISGIPPIVTGEFAKIDAGIKATALFFAPLTSIVPCRRFSPVIL
ncbi:hypothetical protein D9M71_619330 [compost metagenome]